MKGIYFGRGLSQVTQVSWFCCVCEREGSSPRPNEQVVSKMLTPSVDLGLQY